MEGAFANWLCDCPAGLSAALAPRLCVVGVYMIPGAGVDSEVQVLRLARVNIVCRLYGWAWAVLRRSERCQYGVAVPRRALHHHRGGRGV